MQVSRVSRPRADTSRAERATHVLRTRAVHVSRGRAAACLMRATANTSTIVSFLSVYLPMNMLCYLETSCVQTNTTPL